MFNRILCTGLSPALAALPRSVPLSDDTPQGGLTASLTVVLQPRDDNGVSLLRRHGLGCSPFARRYSGNLG